MLLKNDLSHELEPSSSLTALEKAFLDGRLPHAILLRGPVLDILEKTALSLIGKILGGQQCIKKHPDLFVIRPANKMRQINAETLRHLVHNIQHTALGSNKVALVYQADRLHPAAANIFLKTLEEPPAGTIIILLSTRPYDILPTILSRCIQFNIKGDIKIIQDSSWEKWISDYKQFIEKSVLLNKLNKADLADVFMLMYGLVYRFGCILESLSVKKWEAVASVLDENINQEEKVALESSCIKDVRHQLFVEIETVTLSYVTAKFNQKNNYNLASALCGIINTLEEYVPLLDVNLNESIVLESFLLDSIKIWSSLASS